MSDLVNLDAERLKRRRVDPLESLLLTDVEVATAVQGGARLVTITGPITHPDLDRIYRAVVREDQNGQLTIPLGPATRYEWPS